MWQEERNFIQLQQMYYYNVQLGKASENRCVLRPFLKKNIYNSSVCAELKDNWGFYFEIMDGWEI